MGTVLGLVQRPHAQTADMTCLVVARRNGVVGNRVGTDEADFGIVIVVGLWSSRQGSLVLLDPSCRRCKSSLASSVGSSS